MDINGSGDKKDEKAYKADGKFRQIDSPAHSQ